MALTITVTDKATHAATAVTGHEVSLLAPSVVELPIHRAQVQSVARKGADLVLTTIDGQSIVVHGFYPDNQNDHNELVLQSDDGLWLADSGSLDALAADASLDSAVVADGSAFSSIESIDPLLGDSAVAIAQDSPDWLPPVYALAGFATALAAAAGLGSSPPPKPSKPSDLTATPNSDGTIVVSGKADHGNTVKVVFPDGTSTTATAGDDGAFQTAPSAKPQTSGTVEATATDSHNQTSDPTDYPYVDTFAPLPPSIDSVTENPNGTLTVAGKAEVGSTVQVTFTDGSAGKATAGDDGSYSITSNGAEPTGTLTATATDEAGNKSGPSTHDYTQGAGVSITSIAPDTVGPAGTDIGSANDYITNANGSAGNPLVVHGTVGSKISGSGNSVEISLDGGKTWLSGAGTVDSSGSWSYTLPSTQKDGSYQIEAQVVNATGAQVAASEAKPLVIDTTAPAQKITWDSVDGQAVSPTGGTTTWLCHPLAKRLGRPRCPR